MPVEKRKQKAYGVIVGAMQNKGKSLSQSKKIADKAVKSPKLKVGSFKKYGKKKTK
jgi:hypothetical protein